jgi:hypothetical protein
LEPYSTLLGMLLARELQEVESLRGGRGEALRETTPDSVEITSAAPAPETDPTCGIAVNVATPAVPAPHRLVAVGDSLTQGFQSFAIYNTARSYPRLIADALGWEGFRYPTFPLNGGMPFNLELILHHLEEKYGTLQGFFKVAAAGFEVVHFLSVIESTWEQQWQLGISPSDPINHNLAVWGWDVRDILSATAATCLATINAGGRTYLPNARTGWRTLASAQSGGVALSPVQAAIALGNEGGAGPGIETLIVAIGANNALGTIVDLEPRWSQIINAAGQGTAAAPAYATLGLKDGFNIWQPPHFESEFALLATALRGVNAQHVIVANVPHVTVAPLAHGIGDRGATSRYYEYYAHPWITDAAFDPREDKFLSTEEARAIDSAIDQYNDAIQAEVVASRNAGLDWYHLDLCGLLDRLANRRYYEQPAARPPWWTPYPLPPALQRLQPPVSSRFFSSGPGGREAGGLFALDGVHPTTVGYGIVAQEFMRIMDLAGVKFYRADGSVRPGPVTIDFDALIQVDSLFTSPPVSLDSDLKLLGWLERTLDGLLEALGLRWKLV